MKHKFLILTFLIFLSELALEQLVAIRFKVSKK